MDFSHQINVFEEKIRKYESTLNDLSENIKRIEKALTPVPRLIFYLSFEKDIFVYKNSKSNRLMCSGDKIPTRPLIEQKLYIRQLFGEQINIFLKECLNGIGIE